MAIIKLCALQWMLERFSFHLNTSSVDWAPNFNPDVFFAVPHDVTRYFALDYLQMFLFKIHLGRLRVFFFLYIYERIGTVFCVEKRC